MVNTLLTIGDPEKLGPLNRKEFSCAILSFCRGSHGWRLPTRLPLSCDRLVVGPGDSETLGRLGVLPRLMDIYHVLVNLSPVLASLQSHEVMKVSHLLLLCELTGTSRDTVEGLCNFIPCRTAGLGEGPQLTETFTYMVTTGYGNCIVSHSCTQCGLTKCLGRITKGHQSSIIASMAGSTLTSRSQLKDEDSL
ncbi:hypothetical protein J6590_002019 [Homalodisca vitripennis]|nr:hypothetical protein J6590_002019 [Homalodisca vitripennis]